MKLSTVRSHSSIIHHHPSSTTHQPLIIHHPSSTIHRHHRRPSSTIHLHRVSHSLTITQLFGISAAITGAVAITGNSSSVSSTATSIASPLDPRPIPPMDEIFISLGTGEHCSTNRFNAEFWMRKDTCNFHYRNFTTLRPRVVEGRNRLLKKQRCVMTTFSDVNCQANGAIIADFSLDDTPFAEHCLEVYTMDEDLQHRIPARAVLWTCGDSINKTWADPFTDYAENMSESDDDLPISARSVDVEHSKDHVTVVPADNLNCNSAQDRDTDTKVQGHCHSFDKPFFSLSATIKRADHDSKIGGSEPCSVLVFSDKKCKRDGASIVDLNSTPSLGVCHNVTLHHGKDTAAIAGHSWKWVCGRQNIDNCLKPMVHHSKAHNTAVSSAAKTVTATTSLACTMTTEFAHYLDVLTSVVTLKPVTHTSTSVFTKTKTLIRTKIITSVATDVSTVHHSVTKPYTTTYMVCDAQESSQV
jgi:hypothetical protein